MSERLTPTESVEEEQDNSEWSTGDHYSRMKVDAGMLGNIYYYGMPAFTVLAHTKEELDKINGDFSALLSKYTDDIVVGTPHETSLILSLNQAAADLSAHKEMVDVLRAKIFELTGDSEE